MTTAPPSSEFNPTGVWLDHFLGTEEPPMELFGEFARRGGKGVFLNGSNGGPDLTIRAVDMVHEQGLQAIVTVYTEDLRNAALSKAGLDSIGFTVSSGDGVLITYGINAYQNVPTGQQFGTSEQSYADAEIVQYYGGLLPEKPWLLAVQPEINLHRPSADLYPGPLMGFMLDRGVAHGDRNQSFPDPREARDTVDGWVKNLEGLEPVFYSVALVNPSDVSRSAASTTDIAIAVRDVGVGALVFDSREYETHPEIREVAGRLSGFPGEITEPRENGRAIGTKVGPLRSVVITPDGRQVLSGGEDGILRIRSLQDDEEELMLTTHQGYVHSLALTPDGRRVVSGGADGRIVVRNLGSSVANEVIMTGHRGGVRSVAVTSRGQRVVSGGDDGTVRVWSLETGTEELILTADANHVHSVAVTSDGRRLVSGGDDGKVRIWDLESKSEHLILTGHDSHVHSVAITSDGQRVVSAGRDGDIRVWNIESGSGELILKGDGVQLYSVAVTPDGHRIVSCRRDGTVKVWGLESGEEERTLTGHDGQVWSVAVAPDSQRIVSCGDDGRVRAWAVPPISQVSTEIHSDQPLGWEGITAPDRLGYKPYAAALFQMLSSSHTGLPLSLAVSAPWGSGKTSIMNWVRFELDKHQKKEFHRCTVLPLRNNMDNWGVEPETRRARRRRVARQGWRILLEKAGWRSWPRWAHRRVNIGPTLEAPIFNDPAIRLGLTRKCTTVWIDAWKYESGAALWAAFTKQIYQQAQTQMEGSLDRLKFRLALANGIEPGENGYGWGSVLGAVSWSVFKDRWTTGVAILGGVGIALVSGFAIYAGAAEGQTAAISGIGIGALSSVGGWIGFAKGLIRQPFSFNLDKVSAAVGGQPQPVDTVNADRDISRMIHLLAHRNDEALVVFVDDLDRCSPDKVKDAVEAINLLFNGTGGAQIVFILGMDVDMVSASMQVAYRPMVAELRRVESQSSADFGYRFLSKIVQLSLNIPEPEATALDNYLGGLMGLPAPSEARIQESAPVVETERVTDTGRRPHETAEERSVRLHEIAENNIIGLSSNAARREVMNDAFHEIPREERAEFAEIQQTVIQRENLRSLAGDSPEVRKAIQEGAKTLPPRPRDYKRFVNAVRLQLLVANQSPSTGSDKAATDEQIAKWTALGMRWPNLAAELRARPEMLRELEDWAAKCYIKGIDGWKTKPRRDATTQKTIKANAWSRRMQDLTDDPGLGQALLEDPLLGDANLHGLLSVH